MALGYLSREEEVFFDPRDDLSSVFDSCPPSPATSQSSFLEENSAKIVNNDPFYQVWTRSPCSIQERRAKFKQVMGLDPITNSDFDSLVPEKEQKIDFYAHDSNHNDLNGDRINNLNGGGGIFAHDTNHNGERIFMSSYAQQSIGRNSSSSSTSSEKTISRKRFGWLRRFGAVTCIVNKLSYNFSSEVSDSEESSRTKFRKIQVRPYRKQCKEFSAVYSGQNFKAHHGAILAMKFSPDGQYLASGGEDGVVRIWQVMECARTNEDDIPNDDPNCIYLTVSRDTEVSSLRADKDKMIRSKSLRSTSDSACVVVPPEVFRISEKPLYELCGHQGDVLDLAWSNDKVYLYLKTCN